MPGVEVSRGGDAPRRTCTVCGAAMRRSHVAYLGGNREAVVYRCEVCGVTSQGAVQTRDERVKADAARGGRSERRRRPMPDEGSPDNPVIDSDLARLLRERLGGGNGGD
jgi:uncharacterized Zn finger protein